MRTFLTLDKSGVVASLFVGAWIVLLGQALNLFFLGVMLLFLLLGALVTRVGTATKKKLGVFEVSRSWKNVLANAIVPMLAVLAYYLSATYFPGSAQAIVIGYVASVAAISADKFSSELGVLDGAPRMMLTLKKVKRGVSGAISAAGVFVGAVAAFLISLSLFYFGLPFSYVLIITGIGVLGNFVDSFFGYFENKGIGNKYSSNMLCALSAWAVCMLLFMH